MVTALSTATAGFHDAYARLDRAGEQLARSGAEPGAMVELIKARQQVGVNAAVIRVEDEMVGSLLDVFA
jgi:hypothetical protein